MYQNHPGACRKVRPFSHTYLLPPPTTYEKHESIGSLRTLSDSYKNIGNALKDLGQTQETLSYYEKALNCKNLYEERGYRIRRQRELPNCFRNIGSAYRELGQLQEALLYYKKAIRFTENLVEMAEDNQIVEGKNKLVGMDKAIRKIREATQRGRKERYLSVLTGCYSKMGNVLCDLNQYNEALDYFEKKHERKRRTLSFVCK